MAMKEIPSGKKFIIKEVEFRTDGWCYFCGGLMQAGTKGALCIWSPEEGDFVKSHTSCGQMDFRYQYYNKKDDESLSEILGFDEEPVRIDEPKDIDNPDVKLTRDVRKLGSYLRKNPGQYFIIGYQQDTGVYTIQRMEEIVKAG